MQSLKLAREKVDVTMDVSKEANEILSEGLWKEIFDRTKQIAEMDRDHWGATMPSFLKDEKKAMQMKSMIFKVKKRAFEEMNQI